MTIFGSRGGAAGAAGEGGGGGGGAGRGGGLGQLPRVAGQLCLLMALSSQRSACFLATQEQSLSGESLNLNFGSSSQAGTEVGVVLCSWVGSVGPHCTPGTSGSQRSCRIVMWLGSCLRARGPNLSATGRDPLIGDPRAILVRRVLLTLKSGSSSHWAGAEGFGTPYIQGPLKNVIWVPG